MARKTKTGPTLPVIRSTNFSKRRNDLKTKFEQNLSDILALLQPAPTDSVSRHVQLYLRPTPAAAVLDGE